MNTFLLYLVLKADDLSMMLTLLIFACIGIIISLWCRHVIIMSDYDPSKEKLTENLKFVKITFIVAISLIIICTIVPSTKQLAALYIAPKVYREIKSNKKINGIPDKIVDLANKKLDEALTIK